uniref:Uncharacterized protein n=1 Tax=Arundo donax TaxID=35708 RepID=A0A0A9DVP0_ARUDO
MMHSYCLPWQATTFDITRRKPPTRLVPTEATLIIKIHNKN